MSKPKDAPTGRELRMEIEIGAPPEAVWKALTEGEELSRWFPPEARVTPGVGGKVFLSWGPGCEGEGPIHLWEPGRRFGWQEKGEQTIAVEWEIEATAGGTRVRLVQSGFGDEDTWDDYIDALERGWAYFLHNLGHYLEHHRGKPRHMVSQRVKREGSQAETWQRLMGEHGLGLSTARGGGAPCTLRLGEASYEARVVIEREPWTFAATVPELDDALLFVEMEFGGPSWHCGIWLSTYGLAPERVAALETQVSRLTATAFG